MKRLMLRQSVVVLTRITYRIYAAISQFTESVGSFKRVSVFTSLLLYVNVTFVVCKKAHNFSTIFLVPGDRAVTQRALIVHKAKPAVKQDFGQMAV